MEHKVKPIKATPTLSKEDSARVTNIVKKTKLSDSLKTKYEKMLKLRKIAENKQ